MFRTILLLHVLSTLYMVGLIWFVQLVHYPLFARVGPDEFVDYEAHHTRLTGRAVIPAMLVELGTAGWLAFNPGAIPDALTIAGLALVIGIWGTTALVQVPCHTRLREGFDPATHRRLVSSNWVRTAGWTARAAVIMAMLWYLLN